MNQLRQQTEKMQREFSETYGKLGMAKLSEKLAKLSSQMTEPDFWDDSEKAQAISREAAALTRRLEPWQKLEEDIDDLSELASLDNGQMASELEKQFIQVSAGFEELKEQLKFQGPYDDHDVILSIYAGAGGTDAQDWAEMLMRMYLRWAESRKLQAHVLDESRGEEAGIKSATIQLNGGDFLYGHLTGEHGVHRLVRLSPFNADHKRQTSFAKVDVLPLIDRPEEVEIDPKDLKIDVYRSSGKGGQSVNTTDSAVRVTHLPTGMAVAIQNERSQLQNKETALNVLRSKLAQLSLEQHAENLADLRGPSQSAEWGNQIRNYVLHPYKQVKDTRSGFESSEVEKVLDGNLDPLIDAWLQTVETKA